MTMKTPEQIATEVIGADALAGIGYQHDFEVAVRAIKADRAQHAEERSLNDQLAEEARKVELAGRARLAARGSKHDPEL